MNQTHPSSLNLTSDVLCSAEGRERCARILRLASLALMANRECSSANRTCQTDSKSLAGERLSCHHKHLQINGLLFFHIVGTLLANVNFLNRPIDPPFNGQVDRPVAGVSHFLSSLPVNLGRRSPMLPALQTNGLAQVAE